QRLAGFALHLPDAPDRVVDPAPQLLGQPVEPLFRLFGQHRELLLAVGPVQGRQRRGNDTRRRALDDEAHGPGFLFQLLPDRLGFLLALLDEAEAAGFVLLAFKGPPDFGLGLFDQVLHAPAETPGPWGGRARRSCIRSTSPTAPCASGRSRALWSPRTSSCRCPWDRS